MHVMHVMHLLEGTGSKAPTPAELTLSSRFREARSSDAAKRD